MFVQVPWMHELLLWHSSMSLRQFAPVNPGSQMQLYPLGVSSGIHLASFLHGFVPLIVQWSVCSQLTPRYPGAHLKYWIFPFNSAMTSRITLIRVTKISDDPWLLYKISYFPITVPFFQTTPYKFIWGYSVSYITYMHV